MKIWSNFWGRVLLETGSVLVIEILYVLTFHRPSAWPVFVRRLSDTLFLSGILLFMFSLLYVGRFWGWRRRHFLPRVFGLQLKDLFRPFSAGTGSLREEEADFEELAARDRQQIKEGVKRDKSLLISSLFLLLFSVLIDQLPM